MRTFIFLSVVLSGCASYGDIEQRRNQRLDESHSRYQQEAQRRPGCGDGEKIANLSECHSITRDYFRHYDDTKRIACDGSSKQECEKKMMDILLARYSKEYKHANWAEAKTECDASPSCNFNSWQAFEIFEYMLANSNLQEVSNQFRQELNGIQADAQEEANQRAQKNAQIWQAMGQGFKSNNVNCTSNRVGNTTYTNCY